VKSVGYGKAKVTPTDQRIAVRKLMTEDNVSVAASYDIAIQFCHNCYYGSRHNRISGTQRF